MPTPSPRNVNKRQNGQGSGKIRSNSVDLIDELIAEINYQEN